MMWAVGAVLVALMALSGKAAASEVDQLDYLITACSDAQKGPVTPEGGWCIGIINATQALWGSTGMARDFQICDRGTQQETFSVLVEELEAMRAAYAALSTRTGPKITEEDYSNTLTVLPLMVSDPSRETLLIWAYARGLDCAKT